VRHDVDLDDTATSKTILKALVARAANAAVVLATGRLIDLSANPPAGRRGAAGDLSHGAQEADRSLARI
jgi:hypothetical protein